MFSSVRDFLVGLALGHQLQDLAFAIGQQVVAVFEAALLQSGGCNPPAACG